jgi:hypothetical protein
MRVGALFDLIIAANNVLDHWVGVDTREQVVSRLERLKHQNTDPLLRDLKELREASTALLNDQLEMSASMPGEEDTGIPNFEDEAQETEPGTDDLDRELEEIGKSLRPPDSRSFDDELDEIDGTDQAVPEPPGTSQPVLLTPEQPPTSPAAPPAEVFVTTPQTTPEVPSIPPAEPTPEKPNS